MVPEIMDIITKTIGKDREKCRELVESMIESEMHYLFTNDRDYKENHQKIVRQTDVEPIGDMRAGPPNGRDFQ